MAGAMNTNELVDCFVSELKAVHGEAILCGSLDEARQAVAQLAEELQCARIGATDREICKELLSGLDAVEVVWAGEGQSPQEIGELPVGVVAAEWLLADTGSCAIECETAQERWLCYLPPTGIVVARVEQLGEGMEAVWTEVGQHAADPLRRGELVIVTGPSRTADIEKVLILGAHGPKRLVVVLIG
jgi:L-lactate dehydrogenase complex protein LldG